MGRWETTGVDLAVANSQQAECGRLKTTTRRSVVLAAGQSSSPAAWAALEQRETTMTLKWVAERLQTGAWTHLNKELYEHRKEGGGSNVE